MWNVATSGPSWIMQVSSDRLGGAGSCTWTTSNLPSRSQCRTRAADTSPNCSRATEPLYGNGTALPASDDVGGRSGVSSSPGARTDTWWPSPMSVSARSRTCACTPPGMSHEYGQTMPIRNSATCRVRRIRTRDQGRLRRVARVGGIQVGEPQSLQHVPVARVSGDVRGEGVRPAPGCRPRPARASGAALAGRRAARCAGPSRRHR